MIKNLYTMTREPIEIDFSLVDAETEGYVYAFDEYRHCDMCGHQFVASSDRGWECPRCGADEGPPEPMMNYLYPFSPPFPTAVRSYDEWLQQVAKFPVVGVRKGDQVVGFALTGAGMDFSWEVGGAYLAAGYYPPAWLRLPNMAGIKEYVRSEKHWRHQVAMEWLRGLQQLMLQGIYSYSNGISHISRITGWPEEDLMDGVKQQLAKLMDAAHELTAELDRQKQ